MDIVMIDSPTEKLFDDPIKCPIVEKYTSYASWMGIARLPTMRESLEMWLKDRPRHLLDPSVEPLGSYDPAFQMVLRSHQELITRINRENAWTSAIETSLTRQDGACNIEVKDVRVHDVLTTWALQHLSLPRVVQILRGYNATATDEAMICSTIRSLDRQRSEYMRGLHADAVLARARMILTKPGGLRALKGWHSTAHRMRAERIRTNMCEPEQLKPQPRRNKVRKTRKIDSVGAALDHARRHGYLFQP
jgi:hypothetical protein